VTRVAQSQAISPSMDLISHTGEVAQGYTAVSGVPQGIISSAAVLSLIITSSPIRDCH
jgi:hypothetical protein